MITYILIGIAFMFCIEYLFNKKSIQQQLTYIPDIGWVERTIGILFWPVCLGIFLYNFFKTVFKL